VATMKIETTVHVIDLLDGQVDVEGSYRELAALAELSSTQVDVLCSVLGAKDRAELMPKLYGLAAASLHMGSLRSEKPGRDPGTSVTFAFELASYRLFMGRRLAGAGSPRDIADAVEREQRAWVRGLIARFRNPEELLPDTGKDQP
jgi:hypothetical protein